MVHAGDGATRLAPLAADAIGRLVVEVDGCYALYWSI